MMTPWVCWMGSGNGSIDRFGGSVGVGVAAGVEVAMGVGVDSGTGTSLHDDSKTTAKHVKQSVAPMVACLS